MSNADGWGGGPWGLNPWGSGGLADLRLLDAQPVRENAVRLFFNQAPKFTGVLDPNDASNPDRFNIVVLVDTLNPRTGADPRPVTPIVIEQAAVAGTLGLQLDVVVDRPFSPFPSRYRIAVNQLVAENGALLNANFTSFVFDGLLELAPVPRRDIALPSRDIANPFDSEALLDPLPQAGTTEVGILGSIPVDVNGDYAFDEGITNLKKRVFRRLITTKGKFAHLPDYGVGFPDQLKRLGKPSVRAELANEAELQIAQEPEVERVSVRVVEDAQSPGLFRLRIKVKAKSNSDPVNMDVPFAPIGG